MPVDNFEEMMRAAMEENTSSSGGEKREYTWTGVWEIHTEGGGPFKGRDNALFGFVSFLRAKSFPFDAGLWLVRAWNRDYCVPPLADDVLEEKMRRAWAQWNEGTREDEKPDHEKREEEGKLRFLTWSEMEEEEARIGSQKWIIEGGIPAGGLVYVTGAPAGGKSWVALDLMRAVVRGGLWLGKYPAAKGNALYIDEEMGVPKARPRMTKLGFGPEDEGLFRYTNKAGVKLDNALHLKQITELVKANAISLIVIDTLTRIHEKDENDNSQMRKIFEATKPLTAEGATVVMLHHDRKGGQGQSSIGHERGRGASEVAASADHIFGVEKHAGYYRLVTTKTRLLPDDEAINCDFEIADNEDRTRVELREVTPEDKSERRIDDVADQILTVLRDRGALNTNGICEHLPINRNTIVAALSQMVVNRQVTVEEGPRRSKIYTPA